MLRKEYPSNGGTAKYEKYGDIYGDKVLVASGCAEYSYHYRIKDESGLTVRERDAFFQAIDDGVQSFLDRQTEEDLKNEKAMDTALADEMDALEMCIRDRPPNARTEAEPGTPGEEKLSRNRGAPPLSA